MRMTINDFAERYRLRIKKDECGESIILGRYGHIFAYDTKGAVFGVVYMPDPHGKKRSISKKWAYLKQRMLDGGFRITLDCDGEGIAVFDPLDHKQVKVALGVAGCKRKKAVTPEMLAGLEKARMAKRS